MVQWKHKIRGPYHFDLILDRLAMDPLNHIDIGKRQVKVPLYFKHGKAPATVQAIGTADNPEFEITYNGQASQEVVQLELERLFQWSHDLMTIHDHFTKTDLSPIFDEHRGTPIVLDFGLYQCLVKCIIHQQLNLAFAFTLTKRFVETYGEEIDGVYFYPEPETVAKITVEELRELQFSGRKAEYAIGLSKLIVEGDLDLDRIHELDDEAVKERLIKIRGIGRWTAENFLMFGLGRQNLFPVADIGLQNALKKLYNMERKPSIDEMNEWAVHWNPYMTYASLYLWRSIE